MIILIPLGGLGERFIKNNYTLPKALVNIFGKPILYYLLDSLKILSNIDFVYIPYNKEYANYRFEDKLMKDFPNIKFKFLKLEKNTEGAAETINIALKELDNENTPILCLDSDNFYSVDIINLWNGKNKIITIEDNNLNPIYSYVKFENNKIIDIVEKVKISNYACTGAYGFSSYKQLLLYSQKILDNKIMQKGEYYTSTVISEMIKDNIEFENLVINSDNWHCLGTPFQLKMFYNNFPKISCINNNVKIKKLRICFDLDNTLVTFPKIKDDYTSVEPIQKNIDFLNYLKSFGHTIIIYTARRMNTHKGNVGKLLSDIGKITFDTLDKFGIVYDEIYFGKPNADMYIDDLAYNCFDNLEKLSGFYMDNILPRDFNTLELDSIEIYTKKSDDLSGEIYYYNNIPKCLKDLFPILIDYDVDNKWYKIEKIKGMTVTNLFLSELLKPDTLIHIMNSIKRIQSTPIVNKNKLNIYGNYCEKLKNRFNNYDYSKFKDSDILYDELYKKLLEYENLDKGKMCVIHGDSVMTNIIINKYEKIKFIDMRGKINNELTIYGDWLYDWAKLYQSLIGYDKILMNAKISIEYEKKLLTTFEEVFIELYSISDFNNLKLITKSLLFSLIPLHSNSNSNSNSKNINNCIDFYNLIQKIN